MIALFGSLALLGLAAIDPIGIAAMPVLLLHKRPFARSAAFLGGSFVSLVIMGLLAAQGLGIRILRFERLHSWLVPTVELAAGTVLLFIAATVAWQLQKGKLSTEPSPKLKRQLALNSVHLFLLGAALVAVQSVLDVVFVIAMIRVGQLHLSAAGLVAAVITYAVAALVLQIAVVAAYGLTSSDRRQQMLSRVNILLADYGNQAVMGVSLVFGAGLFLNGLLAALGGPHL